jgi:hypothetical protein
LPIYKIIIPEITYGARVDSFGQKKIEMEEDKLKALWDIL